jgi:hypothetical protein
MRPWRLVESIDEMPAEPYLDLAWAEKPTHNNQHVLLEPHRLAVAVKRGSPAREAVVCQDDASAGYARLEPPVSLGNEALAHWDTSGMRRG